MKKWIYKIVIFILFLILISKVDLNLVYFNIRLIPKKIFTFSLILQVLTILLIGYQWYSLADLLGLNPSYKEILKMNLEGNIIDGITPGSKIGGEVSRLYILKNRLKYKGEEAIILLSLQKILSMLSFTILSIISLMSFASEDIGEIFILLRRGVIFLVIFLSLFIYFLLSKNGRNKILKFLKLRRPKILSSFYEIDRILKKCKLGKTLFKEVILGLIIWILYGFKLFLIIRIFDKKINVLSIYAVSYITYLLAMIPLLPGSIASFEASMVGLLYILGLETKQSISIAIVFRFTSFWFELIISLLVLAVDKLLISFSEGGRYVEKKIF